MGATIMSKNPLFPPKDLFPRKKDPFRFALFAPEKERDVEEFRQSFEQHLRDTCKIKYTLEVYYRSQEAQLVTKMRAQPYDLMISLDNSCTIRARELVSQISPDTPLIFSSISYDEGEHAPLINRMTGISTPIGEYATQMSLVLSYTPSIKKILLLQDNQDHCMQEVGNSLHALLISHDYIVTSEKYSPKISRQNTVDIAKHDMVILLGQHFNQEYIQRLAVLCREHKTILYISNTGSVAQGAAFGFGKDDTSMGIHAARLAHQIITSERLFLKQQPFHTA